MKKLLKLFVAALCSVIMASQSAYAWGPEGHAIIGRLALRFAKPNVRDNVLKLLGTMSIDTAANWMDIMKSNSDYDYMRSWHYTDFSAGKTFVPPLEDNLISRLILTQKELEHKKLLCEQQVQTDLLILLHLMGDLQMPLHTAYEEDLGGNTRMVQYDTLKTHNLHRFWDEDIIGFTGITDQDCINLYESSKATYDTINSINYVGWMEENRLLLDSVYNLGDGYIISDKYLQWSKAVVTKQLLLGGLRLAALLDKLFYSPSAPVDFKTLTKNAKRGIDILDAPKYVGKQVTVCEHIYSVKEGPTITQISLGAKYPNNPLTIIIFAKSYENFKLPLKDRYQEKNVCVKGEIAEYKGKMQIVVEDPKDITIF